MRSCFQAHLFNAFLNFLEFRQQTPKAAAASLSLLFICGRPEWVSMRSNPVQQDKVNRRDYVYCIRIWRIVQIKTQRL